MIHDFHSLACMASILNSSLLPVIWLVWGISGTIHCEDSLDGAGSDTTFPFLRKFSANCNSFKPSSREQTGWFHSQLTHQLQGQGCGGKLCSRNQSLRPRKDENQSRPPCSTSQRKRWHFTGIPIPPGLSLQVQTKDLRMRGLHGAFTQGPYVSSPLAMWT